MIEIIFIFIVYLVITIIVFFSTRYRIISGEEIDLMYQKALSEYTKNDLINETTTTSEITDTVDSMVNDINGANIQEENTIPSDVLGSMNTSSRGPRTGRELLASLPPSLMVGFEDNTKYRKWSLVTSSIDRYYTLTSSPGAAWSDGAAGSAEVCEAKVIEYKDNPAFTGSLPTETGSTKMTFGQGGPTCMIHAVWHPSKESGEVFRGSKQLDITTDDGVELFLKDVDGNYYTHNYYNALELTKVRPSKGKGLFFFVVQDNSESASSTENGTSRIYISSSKYLTGSTYLLKHDLSFVKVSELTTTDMKMINYDLFTDPLRLEIGDMLPISGAFNPNTRFIMKSTNDYMMFYDIEIVPDSNSRGGFFIKNNNGTYLTVDTDYDSKTRGDITFTSQGTSLFMFADKIDKSVYRLTTRDDTFGLFLTHFKTFNLYDRGDDIATLENTKFTFHLIQNSYPRPMYYPTCNVSDPSKVEIWNQQCHTKCDAIETPNPYGIGEGEWWRDYTQNEDGEITGGLCKRYGKCPKNYVKRGLVCYEDCALRGEGWFNGSLLECAKCNNGWHSDGALLCKKDGAKWYDVFTGGYVPWHQRTTRRSEGYTGARIYTSDIVNTTTGKDGANANITRTTPMTPVNCGEGETLAYVDDNDKIHDTSNVNAAETTFKPMCLSSCYNTLYEPNPNDKSSCIRKDYNNASRENF